MILLDTDHLSVFTDERDARHERLAARLDRTVDPVACTIVSVEEALRGWLALVNRLRDVHRQIPAYFRLGKLFDVLADWDVMPWDEAAADLFLLLRRRIRIGTMDLKIAAIALTHDALLLTTNLRDFSLVPDLRCEDWLKPDS
jgi:tRNA(fMet)-specific endonuclease VapC